MEGGRKGGLEEREGLLQVAGKEYREVEIYTEPRHFLKEVEPASCPHVTGMRIIMGGVTSGW